MNKSDVDAITKPGRHRIEHKLYLRITEKGGRAFYVELARNKFQKLDCDAGSSLKAVREARDQALLAWSNNPNKSKDRKKSAIEQMTFTEAANEYLETVRKGWKTTSERPVSKTEQNWRRMIDRHIGPALGDKPVLELTALDCAEALRPLWFDNYPTAKKFRQYMEKVILSAQAKNGAITSNPVSGELIKIQLSTPNHKVKHHPAPTVKQLKDFIGNLGDSVTANCFRLMALSVVRNSEARTANLEQFDFDNDIWTVTPKMGETFRIPMTKQIKMLVKSLEGEGNLFTYRDDKPISDAMLSKLVRDAGETWVPHGVRACFTTWAEDEGIDHAVREMCLDHRKRGVEAAYARSDLLERRRVVMEQWATMLFS